MYLAHPLRIVCSPALDSGTTGPFGWLAQNPNFRHASPLLPGYLLTSINPLTSPFGNARPSTHPPALSAEGLSV